MKRALRMTVFALTVAGLAGWLLVARASARLDRQMLDVGGALTGVSDAGDRRSAGGLMRINGERMWLAAGMSRHSVDAVIDEVASHCRDAAWEIDGAVRHLRSGAPLDLVADRPGLSDGVLAAVDGSHGYAACLVAGATPSSSVSLRYVYARRVHGGTEIAAVWTEPGFSVDPLLHRGTGDAPGSDVPGVPRPIRSQRVLSVERGDGSEQMAIYRTGDTTTPDAILRTLRRDLRDTGWTAGSTHTAGDARVIEARRDGRVLTAVVSTSDGAVSTVFFATEGT